MKHIKQGYGECLPTTVAMLSGKPPKVVMDTVLAGSTFEEKVWVDYCSFLTEMSIFNQALFNSELDNMVRVLHTFVPWLPITNIRCHDQLGINGLTFSELPDELPPGRGAISFGRPGAGHVVAYENGTVFDGDISFPVEWEAYRHRISILNWTSIIITPEPKEGENEKG